MKNILRQNINTLICCIVTLILAAFTMGKVIGLIGNVLDRHFRFVSFLTEKEQTA